MSTAQIQDQSVQSPKVLSGLGVFIIILGLLDFIGALLGWVSVLSPNASALLSPDTLNTLTLTNIQDSVVGLSFILSGAFLLAKKRVTIVFFGVGVLFYVLFGVFAFQGKSIGGLSLLLDAFILYHLIDFKKKGLIV